MTVHIAGAGLAGLAAAVASAEAGYAVVLHEAAGHAGGRVRSHRDEHLGLILDNGTHVLLGANDAAWRYIERIGSARTLVPAGDRLPFRDLETGSGWSVPLAGGALGAMLGTEGVRWTEVPRLLSRMGAARGGTVHAAFSDLGPLYARVLAPLALAVMNRPPDEADAAKFRSVLWRLLRAGAGGLRPWLAKSSLEASFVRPAIEAIARSGGQLRLRDGLTGIDIKGGRLTGARFASGRLALGREDRLVLALPPRGLAPLGARLVAGAVGTEAIVNAHFVMPTPPRFEGDALMLGLTGGLAQWLAYRRPVLSVTVGGAGALLDWPAPRIADRLWRDVAAALGRDAGRVPPVRIVKERRATVFCDHPPGPATAYPNLLLAGGWTVAGSPDTIDSAVRSGERILLCL